MTMETADGGGGLRAPGEEAASARAGGQDPALPSLLESMEAERARLREKIASLEEAVFDRDRGLARSGERERALRAEVGELQEAYRGLRAELGRMKAEARGFLEGVESIRAEQEPLERKALEAEGRAGTLKTELERVEAEKGRLEEALEIAGQKNIRLTREREDHADEVERMLRDRERLKALLHASGQYAVELARSDPRGGRHASAAAGEDPEDAGAAGGPAAGWFRRKDRKVTRLTVVMPGEGHLSVPFRTGVPERIRDDGQAILFDIAPGGAAYLSSKETSDFSLPPRKRTLQLSPKTHCTLSGSVALSGGSVSLWVIEYDDRQRIQDHKVKLKGGPFLLSWRTHPSLDRLCLAFRLHGKGSMTLDPIVLKLAGPQAAE